MLAWAVLTLAVTGFYWRLVLTNQYTWMAGTDIAYQVLPWFQFQAGEWQAGRFPLWDPNHWYGQPLAGQAQPGVFYPLNWILFSLPLRNGWLKPTHLHWYYVAIHLMAAWFAYWLARDLKLSRRAGALAGLIFTLAGWLGTTDWPQMINGAVWAPLIFLFVFRAARGERVWLSAALGGLFLGMSWLSGHHQIPIYLSLTAAGVWLWAARRDWRLVGGAAGFFALAARISADKLQAKVGTVQRVLVDAIEETDDGENVGIARSYADAPEIDGTVRVEDADELVVGQFVEVEITGADTYDLSARVVED